MYTKKMQVLNMIVGILLIGVGIYCLCNQDVAVMSAGWVLCVFMLLAGIAELGVFFLIGGAVMGSGWLLLDGILTVVLSLFLLFNQRFTMLSLAFLFALWLLLFGISRLVSALDLRTLGVRAWGWALALGILLIVAGFVCMRNPLISTAAVGIVVGFVFLLQGVSAIFCIYAFGTKEE